MHDTAFTCIYFIGSDGQKGTSGNQGQKGLPGSPGQEGQPGIPGFLGVKGQITVLFFLFKLHACFLQYYSVL